MPHWKNEIDLSDIFEKWEEHNIEHKECANLIKARFETELSKVLETDEELQGILDELEAVEEVADYNEAMQNLYNWADLDHACFIKWQ